MTSILKKTNIAIVQSYVTSYVYKLYIYKYNLFYILVNGLENNFLELTNLIKLYLNLINEFKNVLLQGFHSYLNYSSKLFVQNNFIKYNLKFLKSFFNKRFVIIYIGVFFNLSFSRTFVVFRIFLNLPDVIAR